MIRGACSCSPRGGEVTQEAHVVDGKVPARFIEWKLVRILSVWHTESHSNCHPEKKSFTLVVTSKKKSSVWHTEFHSSCHPEKSCHSLPTSSSY